MVVYAFLYFQNTKAKQTEKPLWCGFCFSYQTLCYSILQWKDL